ncbi:MAG TPA: DUF2298 domain-containing protein, partial [Abditibacteriaceae bacterium]
MSVWTFLTWFVLVWALGWLALPFASRIWRDTLPDAGLAAGRILLLCGWTMSAFWLGHLRIATRWTALLIFAFAAVSLFLANKQRDALREMLAQKRRAVITSEAIFLGVFLLFFALRGFWPDINNGEKPMDMALIGACARADFLPPPNPYAAGERLSSYYYFGHLQTALLTNAVFSSPRWTYNLMCATLPALCFSTLAMLCGALTGRVRNGVAAAFALLCLGTLQPIVQWNTRWQTARAGGEPFRLWPLDYFATSRVIPSGEAFTINEYPWFTFNYGDLHAHLFAMPLAILTLSLAWVFTQPQEEKLGSKATFSRRTLILATLCSLALGAQIVTNTWDFPTYALVVFLVAIFLLLKQQAKSTTENAVPLTNRQRKKQAQRKVEQPQTRKPNRYARAVVLVVMIGFYALLLAAPFLLRLHSEAGRPQLLQQPASPALPWLLMWGLLSVAWSNHLWLESRARMVDNGGEQRWMMGFAVAGLFLWIPIFLFTGKSFFVLFFLVASLVATTHEVILARDVARRLLAIFALCGWLALLWAETTWAGFLGPPYHRQDTVFKFGLQTWYLLGIAAAGSALLETDNVVAWRKWALPFKIAFALLIPVAVLSSISTTFFRAHNFERHGVINWNAWAHLAPGEQDAAQWLESNLRDGEHLIEAERRDGGDYSEFTRYAHATGIPTVVGPQAHTFQWGMPWSGVYERKAAVRSFYTGVDAMQQSLSREERLKMVRTYHVRYVVCGALERREYGAD